jgi:hypothetical protein
MLRADPLYLLFFFSFLALCYQKDFLLHLQHGVDGIDK